jgi:hypothetical protein
MICGHYPRPVYFCMPSSPKVVLFWQANPRPQVGRPTSKKYDFIFPSYRIVSHRVADQWPAADTGTRKTIFESRESGNVEAPSFQGYAMYLILL